MAADSAFRAGKDGKSAQQSMVDSVNETKAKVSESMAGK